MEKRKNDVIVLTQNKKWCHKQYKNGDELNLRN